MRWLGQFLAWLVILGVGSALAAGVVAPRIAGATSYTVVTHRVVGLGFDAAGDPMITTQGDANEAPDTKPVRDVQVKGELWYSVPYLGRINTLLTGSERQWAVYGVAALLLAYTAQAWGSAWRDRRRRMERNDEAITPHAPTPA
jgi:signal peptidase